MPTKKRLKKFLAFGKAVLTIGFIACAVIGYRVWPRKLYVSIQPRFPAVVLRSNRIVLPFSPEVAAAEVATFDDQLEAFLRFEYLRGREAERGSQVVLAASHVNGKPVYRILVMVENDLLAAIPRLMEMEGRGLITQYKLETCTKKEANYYVQQTNMFEAAYDVPTTQKLESLSSFQLFPALADFLIFKSQTDSRVLGGNEATARPLTREQAKRLAADILEVAYFYSLPLDYFLGVGAMENNYMDANGDLTHAVWKKRAQRDDIVLRHKRKSVLVSDYSIGTWQISRETLRYAHQLYRKDTRNYELLPERLRPPQKLDLNSTNDEVLTTYAGLLLRDLLDHFDGDVDKAIGAYNGGVRSPNPAYAKGVKTVAAYARRAIEHATILDDAAAKENAEGKPLTVNGKDVQPWWNEP